MVGELNTCILSKEMNYFNCLGFSGFQTQQFVPMPTVCVSPNVCLFQMPPMTIMYPCETRFAVASTQQKSPLESTEPSKISEDREEDENATNKNASGNQSKKNMRNIIPNIAHKILRFISSDESRELIKKRFPELS